MDNESRDNLMPDVLPPDYQAHIDGDNETTTEKMERLENQWLITFSEIFNNPLF